MRSLGTSHAGALGYPNSKPLNTDSVKVTALPVPYTHVTAPDHMSLNSWVRTTLKSWRRSYVNGNHSPLLRSSNWRLLQLSVYPIQPEVRPTFFWTRASTP